MLEHGRRRVLSDEARRRMSDSARQRNAARTHCKRGHEFRRHAIVNNVGARVCIPCRRIRKRDARRRAAGLDGAALVAPGQSFLSIRCTQGWAKRRAKWPDGQSPKGIAARAKIAAAHRAKRWCRSGLHRRTPENTILRKDGKRTCRPCVVMCRWQIGNRERIRKRIYRTKQARLTYHPDGPTPDPERFILYTRRIEWLTKKLKKATLKKRPIRKKFATS